MANFLSYPVLVQGILQGIFRLKREQGSFYFSMGKHRAMCVGSDKNNLPDYAIVLVAVKHCAKGSVSDNQAC